MWRGWSPQSHQVTSPEAARARTWADGEHISHPVARWTGRGSYVLYGSVTSPHAAQVVTR